MAKIKVLMPIIRGGGGFEVFQERLAKSLQPYPFKVKLQYYSDFFWFFPQALTFLKQKKYYDIIHAIPDYGHIFRKWGKHLVLTCHHLVTNKDNLSHSSQVKKIYYKYYLVNQIKKSLQEADKIIVGSQHTKKEYEKTFSGIKTKVIYHGIDEKKYAPKEYIKENKKIRILFVGNLIARKGADLLPRIMGRLGKQYELYYTQGLRTKRTIDQESCHSLGRLTEDELIIDYNKCDMLLHPSRLEGFGYSVAEAMACGKPIIATNTSSLPELLIDGKGGFLCKMDDVDDFVGKIRLLGKNTSLRKKMGKFNRERVIKKFTLAKMGKEYAELFSKF